MVKSMKNISDRIFPYWTNYNNSPVLDEIFPYWANYNNWFCTEQIKAGNQIPIPKSKVDFITLCIQSLTSRDRWIPEGLSIRKYLNGRHILYQGIPGTIESYIDGLGVLIRVPYEGFEDTLIHCMLYQIQIP